MSSDNEMKAIEDKIRDLENEKQRLEKERKELLDKASILYNDLLLVQNNFLKWARRVESFEIYLIIWIFICFLLAPFMASIVSFSVDDAITGMMIGFGFAFLLMFFGIVLVFYIENRAKQLYIQFTKLSSECNNIQSHIKLHETKISEISDAIITFQQRKKGLFPFVDRLGRKRFGTPEQIKKWKIMDMDMKNRFSRLKPREFEKLIRELFVKMGFEAHLTSYTADFGADIIAKKGSETIVIQVKKYSGKHKVGSPEVQRLLGSMFKYKANKAIFITTSDFTEEAQEQARGAPIELWNYAMLNKKIEQYLLNLKNNNL